MCRKLINVRNKGDRDSFKMEPMLIFADNSRWQHSDWKRSADDIATKNIFHCLVKRYDTRGSHHCVAHLQRRSHCRQLKFLRQRYKTKFRKFQLERNYFIRITLNIQHRLCKCMCDLWLTLTREYLYYTG